MPTKPNKAGQQQNYVPQGNGDASGEYADNQSGSNIHFTNFKKPDEIETTKTETFKTFKKTKEESTSMVDNNENDIKIVRKNARNSLIKKCVNPSRDNDITFEEVIEDSNDESVKILNQYLGDNEKLTIRFGNAGRNAAGCAWGYSNITTNHSVHTIRHELGHTFDNWYGKNMPANGRNNFESSDYASVRFVDDETGKTMNETLHEELGVSMYKATLKGWKIGYVKQGTDKRETKIASADKINSVFNKYADKIFDEQTGIKNARLRYKELRIRYNELNGYNSIVDKELENLPEKIEYEKLLKEVYRTENEYRDKMIKAGATSIVYDNSPEITRAREQASIARTKYNNKRAEVFRQKFGEKDYAEYEKLSKEQYGVYRKLEGVAGLVGDTLDYLGVGTTFYQTNGHGSHYFKERKEAGYALEIFANMFDCYSSKDTWEKECVKEMFPKTSKIFEKIYYNKGAK